MPFLKHISQLRKCVFLGLMIYAFITGIAYFFANSIYELLCEPLTIVFESSNLVDSQQRRMIFTGISDAFFLQLKLASTIGLIVSLPIIMVPVANFAWPGLHKSERRRLVCFSLISLLLFVSGVLVAYYFAMPITWRFMVSFESMYHSSKGFPVLMNLRADEYFSSAMKMLSGFGFVFQLPLVVKALHFVGVLSIDQIRQSRRYVIVIIFVLAAFLTPPDVISQVCMAIPMIILYELSVLWCRLGEKKNDRKE